ncbi:hypothetical protein PSHT_11483 [Puccinia striiformis]|uniref:Uncharacterized protein n=1 Tax=Puccinia striiformis TaxID=27350 RepID=A0A2S4V2T1_9BASI|nr:hypothetical protein PSHT_11483 [Puccinia striiformis]
MNHHKINQLLRLNGGENEFQESFLAPSQPPIEQGDSSTGAPHYSNAITGVPHYSNPVTGAQPTTTATMTARPQPNLAIQPQVGSEIGNAHAGQLVSGSGNVHAGQLGRLYVWLQIQVGLFRRSNQLLQMRQTLLSGEMTREAKTSCSGEITRVKVCLDKNQTLLQVLRLCALN